MVEALAMNRCILRGQLYGGAPGHEQVHPQGDSFMVEALAMNRCIPQGRCVYIITN